MFDITKFIGTGKENAVTREQLAMALNLSDRAVRKLIQDARDRGEIIINEQDGEGYYISGREEDLHKQYRANQNRAMSILKQQKHLRAKIQAKAAERSGQMELNLDLVSDITEGEKRLLKALGFTWEEESYAGF